MENFGVKSPMLQAIKIFQKFKKGIDLGSIRKQQLKAELPYQLYVGNTDH